MALFAGRNRVCHVALEHDVVRADRLRLAQCAGCELSITLSENDMRKVSFRHAALQQPLVVRCIDAIAFACHSLAMSRNLVLIYQHVIKHLYGGSEWDVFVMAIDATAASIHPSPVAVQEGAVEPRDYWRRCIRLSKVAEGFL